MQPTGTIKKAFGWPKKLIFFLIVLIVVIPVIFILFFHSDIYLQNGLLKIQDHPIRFSLIASLLLVADIFIPVPSSIVLWLFGVVLGFKSGCIIAFIACVLNNVIGYWAGYFGFKIKANMTNINLNRYSLLMIMISRGIPMLSETVSILSGSYRIPFKNFLLASALGNLPVTIIFTYVGYMGMRQDQFLNAFFISMIVSFLLWWIGIKWMNRI